MSVKSKSLLWCVLCLSCFVATALATTGGRCFPDDVGTNRLGVLQQDMRFEFPGAWIRPHPGPFVWGQVERVRGHYDWREVDSTVSKLQERRLAILATVWPFAGWDQRGCRLDQSSARGAFGEFGDFLYMPCDLDAYAAWVTALVERLDGDGVLDMPGLQYPIRHWEVLNEPEMQGPELCFFQEAPDRYAELLARTYAAIREADPSAIVLLAGQAGMHREAREYWRPVLWNPGLLYDIANVHSINCSDIQQDAAFWAPEYAAFLTENGHAGRSFWITEAATGTMDPKSRLSDPAASEDRNARNCFVGTVVAFAEGAERIFHCVAFDPLGRKPQQVVRVFNLLGSTIGAFERVERLAPSVVRFILPDGREIYALWDGSRLPDDLSGPFVVTTYRGETSHVDAEFVYGAVPTLAERSRL